MLSNALNATQRIVKIFGTEIYSINTFISYLLIIITSVYRYFYPIYPLDFYKHFNKFTYVSIFSMFVHHN